MAKILLLDSEYELKELDRRRPGEMDAVFCLFWIAPSTRRGISETSGVPCYGVREIVGSEMDWGERAHRVASEITHEGPLYRGLYWRTYLTEQFYREAYGLQLLMMTAELIEELRRKWAARSVMIEGMLREDAIVLLTEILSNYSHLTYQPSEKCSRIPARTAGKRWIVARLIERHREVLLTGNWRSQAMEMVEWLDKTGQWRAYVGSRRRPAHVPQGGVTFFSSYVNNSRVLAPFADLMPGVVNWVLTNDSSRRGLPKGSHRHLWIWQFAKSKPSHEFQMFDDPLGSRDVDLFHRWVAAASTWRNWTSVERSLLITLTQCWESYLEEAKPRLVVMANQWGIEGWFTLIAKRHNIPVLQVLHGIPGGYLYTQTPILSDLMIVPGDFWRNLWPPDQQWKILSYNPGSAAALPIKKKSPGKRQLTFFSWPMTQVPFHNCSELMDEFIHIFHKLVSQGRCRMNYRAHPQENPSHFVRRWLHLYGRLPREVRVSKNEPLSHVLAETDVALMFRSTVMLDCLAKDIPVVMPGWLDFGWSQPMADLPNVFLASDFPELEQRMTDWLHHPPPGAGDLSQIFLKRPGEGRDAFQLALHNLITSYRQTPPKEMEEHCFDEYPVSDRCIS